MSEEIRFDDRSCQDLRRDLAAHFGGKLLLDLQKALDLEKADFLAKKDALEEKTKATRALLSHNNLDCLAMCYDDVLRYLSNNSDWQLCSESDCDCDSNHKQIPIPNLLSAEEVDKFAFVNSTTAFKKTVKIGVIDASDLSWDKIPLEITVLQRMKLSVKQVVEHIQDALDKSKARYGVRTPWTYLEGYHTDEHGVTTQFKEKSLPIEWDFGQDCCLIYAHPKTFAEVVSLEKTTFHKVNGVAFDGYLATVEIQISLQGCEAWTYCY